MSSIAEKLVTIAENVPKVYAAGQSSMVDESKIIEKNVSGAFISVDDVSEIPHSVGCKVSGVDDLTSVKVTRCGKNLFDCSKTPDSFTSITGDANFTRNDDIYTVNINVSSISENVALNFDQRRNLSNLKPNTTYTVCVETLGGQISGKFRLYIYSGHNFKQLISIDNSNQGVKKVIKFTTTDTDYSAYRIYGFYVSKADGGCVANNVKLRISCYEGNYTSEAMPDYEPYNGQTLTPNADGIVEGITSLSPYMSIFTDNAGVTLDVTYRKSWGMQTEYDRFWDSFQSAPTTGAAQFAGRGWNINTFKPKYDIKVRSGVYLFYNNGVIGDLVEILNELGVSLDTSKMTSAHYLFCDSYFSRVGEIDFRNLKSNDTAQAFASPSLRTIDKLIVKEESNVLHSSTFTNATGLKNITIEGTLACSVNFKNSPLSKDSILSVFNSLSDTITGTTLTLKLSAVNTAFETSAGAADGSTSEEWAALIATKTNWTISLV